MGPNQLVLDHVRSIGVEEARMSVLDQVRALERQVQKRLRELGPLVAEYRDLEKVAERLGLKRDDPAQAAADAGGSATPHAATPPPNRRAKRAARAGTPNRAARKPKAAAANTPSAKPKATAPKTS